MNKSNLRKFIPIAVFSIILSLLIFFYNTVPNPKLTLKELYIQDVFQYEIDDFLSYRNGLTSVRSEDEDTVVTFHVIRAQNYGRTAIAKESYRKCLRLQLLEGSTFISSPFILKCPSFDYISEQAKRLGFNYSDDMTLKLPMFDIESGDFIDFVVVVKHKKNIKSQLKVVEGKIRGQGCIQFIEYKPRNPYEKYTGETLHFLSVLVKFIFLVLLPSLFYYLLVKSRNNRIQNTEGGCCS